MIVGGPSDSRCCRCNRQPDDGPRYAFHDGAGYVCQRCVRRDENTESAACSFCGRVVGPGGLRRWSARMDICEECDRMQGENR